MHRRTVLSTLSAVGTGLLAGCSLGNRTVHEEPATAEKFTRTDTATPDDSPTPTEASTPTRRAGDVPEEHIVDGTAVSADDMAVTADRWFGYESLSYEAGTDDVDTVEPDAGLFVAYDFTIENVGESSLAAVPDSEFLLGIDGETYDHIHSFPGDVSFDTIDQPTSEPRIRPLAWYESLAPGEAVQLQLVYDVPSRPEYRHYLVWEHDGPVEGSPEPAYLTGEYVPTGSD